MVNMTKVRDILLDIPYISNIVIVSNSLYRNKGFFNGIKCDLLIKENRTKIFIGIPKTWVRDLFTIYLCEYDKLLFMPHIESDGKICLYDLEGVLIDYSFEGLLVQCVQRAKTILEKGIYEDNTVEFVREFSSNWSYQEPKRYMKFALPQNHKSQMIKYTDRSLIIRQKNKEKYSAFLNRKQSEYLFAAAEQIYFSQYNKNDTQKNGLFLHVESDKYILPPDFRKPLQVDFINNIRNYSGHP